MLSRVKIVIAIAAIAVLSSLFISNWLRTTDNRPTLTPQLTTLEDIMAGKFPTASDKQGRNGILVEVDGLRVTRVHKVFDGDWHIDVTDGKVRLFITELTPYWLNHGVTVPVVGSVIDEIGYVYCDTEHENETFHGNTCWEIHPVIKWTIHNPSPEQTAFSQTHNSGNFNSVTLWSDSAWDPYRDDRHRALRIFSGLSFSQLDNHQ